MAVPGTGPRCSSLVSSRSSRAGLVASRQTFVRRCQAGSSGRALHRSNGATVVGNRFSEIHLRSRKWPGCRSRPKAHRDLAMFNVAIDSKLRACDVVALTVEDVAPNGYAIDRAMVRQKKTGRPVKFELTDQARQGVDDYLDRLQDRQFGGLRALDDLPGIDADLTVDVAQVRPIAH